MIIKFVLYCLFVFLRWEVKLILFLIEVSFICLLELILLLIILFEWIFMLILMVFCFLVRCFLLNICKCWCIFIVVCIVYKGWFFRGVGELNIVIMVFFIYLLRVFLYLNIVFIIFLKYLFNIVIICLVFMFFVKLV